MSNLDWAVLIVTLCGIIIYGLYKSRTSKDMEGYFLSNRNLPWWMVLLSIMGTQASAITFMSAPGQAFTDGMRFVQYYFGLPLAMIVLSITFVPMFTKLKVFTAYEYLEQRFDLKTRTFTSALFLLSRGFSTGISIYAPTIILSSLLGWDVFWTNIVLGGLLIIYTVSGGAKAVAYTQQLQLGIIFTAMFIAGYYIVHRLPPGIGFLDAVHVGDAAGKMNVITTGFTENGFNWKDRYNIVSGIIGGFFLAMSYFGTDQSQVGRYLTAKSAKESSRGLLMNGVVKIPMQFFILLIGVLLFTYYQFNAGPVFFNGAIKNKTYPAEYSNQLTAVQTRFDSMSLVQSTMAQSYVDALKSNAPNATALGADIALNSQAINGLRNEYKAVLKKADPSLDTNDTNYIFLRFVVDTLPKGLVGLLIAVIFLASWGSIAAALNSLSSCTMVDFYLRFKKHHIHPDKQDAYEERKYHISRWFTLAWGIFCIIVAEFSTQIGSLIEAVNILGSLFYGVILGIFLVAFYMKKIGGNAVFMGAIIGEIMVVTLFLLDRYDIIGLGFLWLNVFGALGVIVVAFIAEHLGALLKGNHPSNQSGV
jgi:SSS family solute:Na+ symporter